MKKLLAVAVLLSGMAMWTVTAKAATTADLTISVTPLGTKSIAINGGTTATYNFGTLALNVSSISATAVTVDNDGQVPLQVGMWVSNDASWTVAGSTTTDTFNLRALLNNTGDARPGDGDFAASDDLTLAEKLADGTNFAGTYAGTTMPPAGGNSTKDLWLRLAMPDTTTDTAQQDIVVTLEAN